LKKRNKRGCARLLLEMGSETSSGGGERRSRGKQEKKKSLITQYQPKKSRSARKNKRGAEKRPQGLEIIARRGFLGSKGTKGRQWHEEKKEEGAG